MEPALVLQHSLLRDVVNTGSNFVSDAITSRSDGFGGRGLYSIRDLELGEELLRIPYSTLLTASIGQATLEGMALKHAADDARRRASDDNEWPFEETYLVLALLSEDAMRRNESDDLDAVVAALEAEDPGTERLERARRRLYYRSLPTLAEVRQFHPLFQVASQELPTPGNTPDAIQAAIAECGLAADHTAASSYWHELTEMHSKVLSEYNVVTALLGMSFAEQHGFEEWLFCWVMVQSRTFSVELGDDKQFSVMAPFADLLNHSATPTVHWFWDSSSEHFVMAVDEGDATKNGIVPANVELTIDYSPAHSGRDPRKQRPPFYFGVNYGFLEKQSAVQAKL